MISAIVLTSPTDHFGEQLQREISLQVLVDTLASARILEVKYIGDVKEFSSIAKELNATPQKDIDGVLICSTRQPFCTQAVLVDLLHLFWKDHKYIIVSRTSSKRTFPIIISRQLFNELHSEQDISSIIERHPNDVFEVEINDNGIIPAEPRVIHSDVEESDT